MTNAEKTERKRARREAIKEARRFLNRRIGLYSTPAQLRAGARVLLDRTARQTKVSQHAG